MTVIVKRPPLLRETVSSTADSTITLVYTPFDPYRNVVPE